MSGDIAYFLTLLTARPLIPARTRRIRPSHRTGLALSPVFGTGLGVAVGAAVGAAVEAAVGAEVGAAVGTAVRAVVETGVGAGSGSGGCNQTGFLSEHLLRSQSRFRR